jgi:hypothetical protein
MVKEECRVSKISFKLVSNEPEWGGGFDTKSLTISTKTRSDRKIRRIQKVQPKIIALIALHELVHLWQWRRGDKNFDLKIDGEDSYTILSEYQNGSIWHPKSKLKKCVQAAASIEFEAEIMAIRLAKSMGLDICYSKYIRSAKAYCYSLYVLIETGIWTSTQIRYKWYKYLNSSPEWDLNKELLKKLCQCTIDNKHLASTVWDGKRVIKRNINE